MNTNVNLLAPIGVMAFLGTGFLLFVTALVRELARARRAFHSETWPAVTAVFVALLVSQAFDTQLLGGVGLTSLAWTFAGSAAIPRTGV